MPGFWHNTSTYLLLVILGAALALLNGTSVDIPLKIKKLEFKMSLKIKEIVIMSSVLFSEFVRMSRTGIAGLCGDVA